MKKSVWDWRGTWSRSGCERGIVRDCCFCCLSFFDMSLSYLRINTGDAISKCELEDNVSCRGILMYNIFWGYRRKWGHTTGCKAMLQTCNWAKSKNMLPSHSIPEILGQSIQKWEMILWRIMVAQTGEEDETCIIMHCCICITTLSLTLFSYIFELILVLQFQKKEYEKDISNGEIELSFQRLIWKVSIICKFLRLQQKKTRNASSSYFWDFWTCHHPAKIIGLILDNSN